jgi:hypothetical protein
MKSDTKQTGFKREKFRVERFTNPSGEHVFRVTGTTKDCKRIRENYQTKDEADRRQAELYALEKGLELVPMQKTILSLAQLSDAERAITELKAGTLLGAVRFYNDNFTDPLMCGCFSSRSLKCGIWPGGTTASKPSPWTRSAI